MSEAAVRDLLARLEDAWARGDGKAYGAGFTADATYVTFVGTVYRGAQEIGSAHQVLFDKFLRGTRLVGRIDEIRLVADGVAVVISHGDVYKGHRPPARPGKTYTVVREADGQWRVAAFHNTKRRRLLEAISFRFAPETAPAARAVTGTETAAGTAAEGGDGGGGGKCEGGHAMKLMHEFTGVIDAAPARVEERLRARLPGFARVRPGVYALQGGWWYRGEYHLQSIDGGGRTRLVHRIYNVAGPGSRWAVPLANRLFIGFAEQQGTGFRQLIVDLR